MLANVDVMEDAGGANHELDLCLCAARKIASVDGPLHCCWHDPNRKRPLNAQARFEV